MNDLKNNEPELEATLEDVKPEHTIGSLLQKARNEKGLSKEDIAKALNLRLALVTDLENDDFSNTASTTYAKGYIKNYARFVAADAILVQQCIDYQLGVDKSPSMQSFSRKTTREAADNRFTWVTYLIIIVLIGMFVFWWAQKSSFFSGMIDLSKPTKEEQRLTTEPPTQNLEILAPAPVSHTDEGKAPEQPSIENTEPKTPVEHTQANTETEPQAETQQVQVTQVIEQATTENTPTAQLALTEINLELTENCWIKLEDATGKVLILGEKKAGYNKTVSGTAPFKAVLGAPQAVKLSLNGESIDLSHYPKSRVARLTLPLE